MPRVRSSPSGRVPGRVKKPPTSASSIPRAAHHVASGAGRRNSATRTEVRAGS